ncbi:MAG: helix-turn-helix domain-containing protein [Eudoraea sp.]|nr:helix-turn-helix domain-containing protein [Eudoraea sp.]
MANELSMDEAFIKKLTDLLEVNLGNEHFGVQELADNVGLSRSQLHRKLKAIKGRSASRFIRHYRLRKAKEMLIENVATVSEIAYRVGFSSPTYFNTCFRIYYGYPPGKAKYRNTDADQETSINEIEKKGNEPVVLKLHSKVADKPFGKRYLLVPLLVVSLIVLLSYIIYLRLDNVNRTESFVNSSADKSIAVLPFKNYSGDADMDPFCDGMTDEVISRLTKIKAFDKVSSRTSVFKYRDTEKSMPEIASELGVTHILEGNFQKSGDKIKVRLQLINAPLDNHYWSEEYSGEWDSNDIFNIQAAVAENVAKHMNVSITDKETLAIQKTPTSNKEAYKTYLLAKSQKYKENESSFASAIPLFEKAIALDSNYIESYIGLADVWMTGGLVWGLYPEQEAWINGKKALERAQKIDSNYSGLEDILYMGYFYYDWDFERVEPHYQHRLSNFIFDRTPAIVADYAIKTGRSKEAIVTLDKNIAVDPSVGIFYTFKGEALMLLGKREEAIDLTRTSNPLFSDDWWYLRESAKLLYYLGEYDSSKEQLQKALTNFPDYPPIFNWLNAVYSHMDGEKSDTEKHLAALHDFYENGSSGSPAWFIALYYCTLQEYEKAFMWLQRSYDRHEVELTWFKEEPLLIPLQNDPRYKVLYDKIGFSKLKYFSPE